MMYSDVQLFAKIDHDSIQNDTSLQKREFPHSKVRVYMYTCMHTCVYSTALHSFLLLSCFLPSVEEKGRRREEKGEENTVAEETVSILNFYFILH